MIPRAVPATEVTVPITAVVADIAAADPAAAPANGKHIVLQSLRKVVCRVQLGST